MKSSARLIITGVVLSAVLFSGSGFAKSWWYVNPDATGDQGGYSWENAFLRFEDALAAAEYGDEIELCQGTFTPDTTGFADPREAAFVIPAGVLIEGGHEGVPGGGWDPEVYVTVLSGDTNGDDGSISNANELAGAANKSDNVYNIVDVSAADANTIFDGVTFEKGYANGTNHDDGGCVYGNGGGCSFIDCIFKSSYASDRGGTVYVSAGELVFTDCIFEMNAGDLGAAVTVDDGGSAEVSNCEFTNNYTNYRGCVHSGTGSSLQIENCSFSQNESADSGAALYITNGSSGDVTGSSFSDNESTGTSKGGAIHIDESDVDFTGCSFTNNYSAFKSGAVGITDSNCNFVQCVFTGNSSADSKGAVGYYCGQGVFSGCVFTGNSSQNLGGAINGNSGGPSDPLVLTIDGCRFKANTARSGGALRLTHPNSNYIVSNCVFENNQTKDNGGAITLDDTTAEVIYCSFEGNVSTDTDLGGSGGGMQINNENTEATVSDCIFTNNYSDHGGGGLNCNKADANVVRCVFIGNNAKYGGGLNNNNNEMTARNCLFAGNIARGGGGGVQSYQSSPTLINCTIADNIANYNGGVKSGSGAVNNLINCVLWGNMKSDGSNNQEAQIDAGDLTNCCVQGWDGTLGGTDNFGSDPLFVRSGSWVFGPNDLSFDDDTWVEGDYHLQSEAGSFSSSFLKWQDYSQTSPCVDAGRVSDDYDDEPLPNGGQINIGAYGDTIQASKSGTVFCDEHITGDVSGDCIVNMTDFSMMAENWLVGQ